MTYMFILKCALKLVEEIILYYDARSKKHKKININIFYFQYTSIIPGISIFCTLQPGQILCCFPLFMTKYFQVRITALEYSGYFIIFGSLNVNFLQA